MIEAFVAGLPQFADTKRTHLKPQAIVKKMDIQGCRVSPYIVRQLLDIEGLGSRSC